MSEIHESSAISKKRSGLLAINIVCWLITAATIIYYFVYPVSFTSPKYAIEARTLIVESMNIAVYIVLTFRAVFRRHTPLTVSSAVVSFAVFFTVNVVWQFLIWNALNGTVSDYIVAASGR